MMRDDVLKKKMRAGRPEPTLVFTSSTRSALDRLPQKRQRPTLRFVPASAIVFVAVAVLCVVVINNKTIGNLFSGGAPGSTQQFAAGGTVETPKPTPTSNGVMTDDPSASDTPLPTPNPSDAAPSDSSAKETPRPTPDDRLTSMPQGTPGPDVSPIPTDGGVLMQKVNVSSSASGIKATVLEAGIDGYVLALKIKAGPFEDRTEPNNDMKIRINDKLISTVKGYKLDQTWDDTSPGYVTYTQLIPLTKKITGSSVKVELDNNFNVPNELYVNNKQDEANLKFTSVPFQIVFEFAVHTPDQLNASASGKVAFGSQATLTGVYRSSELYTVYALKISDDAAGDLQQYLNKHKSSGSERVVFAPESPSKFQIYLCNRHVDKDFIDGFSCAEAINICLSSGDPKGDGISPWNMMTLEKTADGKFLLTIIDVVNTDLNAKVDSDFTILTKNFSEQDVATSYALQGTIH